MARTLIDKNLLRSIACPAAGATAYTPSLDLNTNSAGLIPGVNLRIYTDALPSLADTKKITLTVQESADNSAWTDAADLPAYTTATGASGAGAAGFTAQFKLPINLKRYLRLKVVVDAAGGDNTAAFAYLTLVF